MVAEEMGDAFAGLGSTSGASALFSEATFQLPAVTYVRSRLRSFLVLSRLGRCGGVCARPGFACPAVWQNGKAKKKKKHRDPCFYWLSVPRTPSLYRGGLVVECFTSGLVLKEVKEDD